MYASDLAKLIIDKIIAHGDYEIIDKNGNVMTDIDYKLFKCKNENMHIHAGDKKFIIETNDYV